MERIIHSENESEVKNGAKVDLLRHERIFSRYIPNDGRSNVILTRVGITTDDNRSFGAVEQTLDPCKLTRTNDSRERFGGSGPFGIERFVSKSF